MQDLTLDLGAVVGGISAGIQSGGDIGAIFTGIVIGGIAGGVGGGIGEFVSTAVGSSYGAIAGFAAGGLAGGTAAGGTQAILYRAAGYNTDIGLGFATGAAVGLIGGSFYGIGNNLNSTWGGLVGGIASAPAAGATAAAIAGDDPGTGALSALRTFALRMGVSAVIALQGGFNRSLLFSKFRDDRREVFSPSQGTITTTESVAKGLIPARTHFVSSETGTGRLGQSLAIDGADINAGITIVDGATAISIAIRGNGAAGLEMSRILGGSLNFGIRAAMVGATVTNGVGGLVLVGAGGYMLGTGVAHFLPSGDQVYDYFHPEPQP